MASSEKGRKDHKGDRLTVTLGPGQRKVLEAIAAQNNATLAFVVRFALAKFVKLHGEGQLNLEFPEKKVE